MSMFFNSLMQSDIIWFQGTKLQPINLNRVVKLLTDPHSVGLVTILMKSTCLFKSLHLSILSVSHDLNTIRSILSMISHNYIKD